MYVTERGILKFGQEKWTWRKGLTEKSLSVGSNFLRN